MHQIKFSANIDFGTWRLCPYCIQDRRLPDIISSICYFYEWGLLLIGKGRSVQSGEAMKWRKWSMKDCDRHKGWMKWQIKHFRTAVLMFVKFVLHLSVFSVSCLIFSCCHHIYFLCSFLTFAIVLLYQVSLSSWSGENKLEVVSWHI